MREAFRWQHLSPQTTVWTELLGGIRCFMPKDAQDPPDSWDQCVATEPRLEGRLSRRVGWAGGRAADPWLPLFPRAFPSLLWNMPCLCGPVKAYFKYKAAKENESRVGDSGPSVMWCLKGTDRMGSLFFFYVASFRCNSHVLQCTHLKCTL